jgi:NADH-quinone oxidoreductase subunit H
MTLKTGAFIVFLIWFRFAMPRLRIDQLMSFCWKVLIPFAFLQIFLNGLVLVYEWPDGLLFVTSGAGLALISYVIYRAIHVAPRQVRLVRGGTVASAPTPAAAEAGG